MFLTPAAQVSLVRPQNRIRRFSTIPLDRRYHHRIGIEINGSLATIRTVIGAGGGTMTLKGWMATAASVLLTALLAGCGSSDTGTVKSATTATTSTAAATTAEAPLTANLLKADRDKDSDGGGASDDTNNNAVLNFGRPAGASDKRAITTLLERYYRAAATENGAAACSMLYSTLAEGVPEDYGSYNGPTYMRGNTCPAVMTLLFKHYHRLLETEVPKLKIAQVDLQERHGLAVLNFGALPEREIQVEREGHVWRVTALIDAELP